MRTRFKCPFCNRRQDVTPDRDGKFRMPWHENYRKTEVCQASEKAFRVATPDVPVETEHHNRGPLLPSGSAAAVLAMLAMSVERNDRRRRTVSGPRYRGNR